MIIFKVLICLGIVLISTYLGLEKSSMYEKRVLELQRIKSGFNFFKSKIEFTYEPIKEILEEISNSIYEDENNIFGKTNKYIKDSNLNYAWEKAISEENKITNEDKEVLKMFSKLIGKTDKKGQISEINLSLNFIDMQIQKAEDSKKKNAKLYKSLGTLIGIGIIIILW